MLKVSEVSIKAVIQKYIHWKFVFEISIHLLEDSWLDFTNKDFMNKSSHVYCKRPRG